MFLGLLRERFKHEIKSLQYISPIIKRFNEPENFEHFLAYSCELQTNRVDGEKTKKAFFLII